MGVARKFVTNATGGVGRRHIGAWRPAATPAAGV